MGVVGDSVRKVSWRIVRLLLLAALVSPSMIACTSEDETASPTISAPPATLNAGCSVSELLVPSCGAWLGSSIPSADGKWDITAGLEEYESATGDQPEILRFFQRGPKVFPTSAHIAAAERPGRPRSLLHFSWKPAPELTWRQIANGVADTSIEAVASQLAKYPHRMFFTVHHEPENDVELSEGSGMTPADYVDMYRHVVDKLRSSGSDNLVFVMVYIGFHRWANLVDDLYPGDDVVDWIGYDPYGFAAQTDFAALLNRPTPESGWPGFYSWATGRSDKPIMVAEWGFDLIDAPDAANVLSGAPVILEDQFPQIKALVYWNGTGRTLNTRLDQPGDAAARFATAFAEMAADPWFNSTSTVDAP